MPCSTLSEEIQDLICEFVPDRSTFQSLCLVSRSWLPSARRALYHSPLAQHVPTWRVADALLDALEANRILGCYVRGLQDLDKWISAPQVRNEGGWGWGLALLECCPYVKDLGTSVRTDEQLDYLAPFLFNLRPTLRHLSLGGRRVKVTLSRISALLEASELSELASLTLDTLSSPVHATPVDFPAPIRLDSLTLAEGFPLPLGSLFQYLPLHKTLTSFNFRAANPHSLVDLLTLLGPTLAYLEIDLQAVRAYRRGLGTYGTQHDGPLLPLPLFSLLPHLRTLSLSFLRGMSLARLAALATHSPALESLELECTTWVADAGGEVFPAAEVGRVLREFGALRKVWLGWLPIGFRRRYAELEEVAEGMEVGYETCGRLCGACGDYHDDY